MRSSGNQDPSRREPHARRAVRLTRASGAASVLHAQPRAADTGLVFFSGALVDPAASAPLLVEVARARFPAVLVDLPRRGAFGGADGPEVLARARVGMRAAGAVRRWVIGGHSKGGAVAARFVMR